MRTDSKYYMYVNDEQFGPFSHQTIIDELQYERLGKDVFVWAEGMKDWTPLQKVESFAAYSKYLPEVSKISNELRNYSWENTQKELDEEFEQKRMDQFESFSVNRPSEAPTSSVMSEVESLAKNLQVPVKRRISFKFIALGLTCAAVLAAGTMGVMYWQQQQFYGEILSHLEGTTLELARMRDTLNGKKTAWAPVSILKERGNTKEPSLFVAGNLPDGTRLSIILEGVPGTLVGALQQSTRVETVLKDRMAYTTALKRENGSALAPGLYSVRVECLTCTEAHTRRMEIRNTIAIGMSDKKIYDRDLNDFHKIVRKQAESELMEVEEILRLVDERLLMTSFKKGVSQEAIQQQLQETLYAINDDVAHTSYIYGAFYLQLKSIYHLMEQKDLSRAQTELESLRGLLKRNRDAFQSSQGYPTIVE